jgi:hypothetical protein
VMILTGASHLPVANATKPTTTAYFTVSLIFHPQVY